MIRSQSLARNDASISEKFPLPPQLGFSAGHVRIVPRTANISRLSGRSSALTHRLHDLVCDQILKMFWKNDASQFPAPR
jgi:hypothetical protein